MWCNDYHSRASLSGYCVGLLIPIALVLSGILIALLKCCKEKNTRINVSLHLVELKIFEELSLEVGAVHSVKGLIFLHRKSM